MNNLSDINTDTIEGKMLLAALSILTTEGHRTSLHPDECLQEIAVQCKKIYPDAQNGIPDTMKILIKALKEDEGYYYSWQANIAMAFYDEVCKQFPVEAPIFKKMMHEIANVAAKNFLNLLTK